MAIATTACSFQSVTEAMGARVEQTDTALDRFDHFKDGRFVSLPAIPKMSWSETGGIFARFLFGEKTDPRPVAALPMVTLDAESFANPVEDGYRVTWLGHSMAMVEIDGLRILTDPVFGERASPIAVMGPKRFQAAPVTIDDLPRLDAVMISHDHYDHLDTGSIKALIGKADRFVAPLGIGAHLRQWGVPAAKITELNWWDETTVGTETRLIAVPARHFSGRGMFDANKTLWASFVIAGADHRLFFSGDTGMHEGFADIGERYGPFDLALLENGAYDPAWPDVHMSPGETVQAAQMLRAERMMPIHWGTFDLANHAWYDPAVRVRELAAAQGVALTQPRQGEAIGTGLPWPVAPWWEDPVQRTVKLKQAQQPAS